MLLTIVRGVVIVIPLFASFVFFAMATWRARQNYGWLVPAGFTCWAFLALFGRFLSS